MMTKLRKRVWGLGVEGLGMSTMKAEVTTTMMTPMLALAITTALVSVQHVLRPD